MWDKCKCGRLVEEGLTECAMCKAARVSRKSECTGSVFNYVDCTGGDYCEGWLNLFFGDEIIALVNNVELANEIRKTISERKQNGTNEPRGNRA